MIYHLVFISSLLAGLCYAQSAQREWAPDELENPLINALKCGFKEKDASYICDPNNIIGHDIHAINWLLKDVAYNSTRCPCSNYVCETSARPTGYKIGIALINKMKVLTSTDGKIIEPIDQSQIFAYTLENTKWNMGKCEEDVVVFYSVEDKTLAIYTGAIAGKRLTQYYKDLIAHKASSRLYDGLVVEALNHIIHDIKMVLNCDSLDEFDCNLYEFKPSRATANLAPFSLAFFAGIFSVFLSANY